MRDIEYILRFFIMKSDDILKSTSNQISLKKALNHFMDLHRNDSPEDIDFYRSQFTATIQAIYNSVGENAFKKFSNESFPRIPPCYF